MRYFAYIFGKLLVATFFAAALYGSYILIRDESRWWWIAALVSAFLLVQTFLDLDDGLDKMIEK